MCQGNDVDECKCAVPDLLEGTNTGASAWRLATGRYARQIGMVESSLKKIPDHVGQWQYVAEWGVQDAW